MRILSVAACWVTATSAFTPAAFAPKTFYRSISSSIILKMATQDELKKQVGYKAVDDYVKSGMVVGLGTGSTAYFAVERVGMKLKSGELTDIVCIPTSVRTKEQAESLGIPLVTLDTHSRLDVAIDGADEVDPDLNLVKGGGGALLREKMVEIVSDKFIVIGTFSLDWIQYMTLLNYMKQRHYNTVLYHLESSYIHVLSLFFFLVDESKLTKALGPGFPIPVEITPFCHEHTMRTVAALPSCEGCKPVLRMGSSSSNKSDGDNIAITDNGNYIVDLHFESGIKDARKMAADIKNVCGVVDHGLFCGMTTAVIIAGTDGITVKEP
jgi:ribose 5-phosphate isomerase A